MTEGRIFDWFFGVLHEAVVVEESAVLKSAFLGVGRCQEVFAKHFKLQEIGSALPFSELMFLMKKFTPGLLRWINSKKRVLLGC